MVVSPALVVLMVVWVLPLRQPQAAEAQNIEARVIGGKPAKSGQYPYAQISLQKPKVGGDDAHQCGGTLIAPEIIITAAHCVGWFTEAHINRYDFDSKVEEYDIVGVKSTKTHENFVAEGFRFDYAVVLLEHAVTNISPVQLNNDNVLPTPGTDLVVLGWGATEYGEDGASKYPSEFMKGKVTSMSNADCGATVVGTKALYYREIFPEMVCASEDGVDACSGDSGGPLILEGSHPNPDILMGIVSWGRGCAIYPGVYSRISMAYDWIRREVCEQSINPPDYLGCQTSERGPIVQIENAAKAAAKAAAETTLAQLPSSAPSQTPTTLAPTLLPTTPMPTKQPTRFPTMSFDDSVSTFGQGHVLEQTHGTGTSFGALQLPPPTSPAPGILASTTTPSGGPTSRVPVLAIVPEHSASTTEEETSSTEIRQVLKWRSWIPVVVFIVPWYL